MKEPRSQLKHTVMHLKVGDSKIIGPLGAQAGLYSHISKCKQSGDIPEDSEFSIKKIYGIYNDFSAIVDGIYEITRTK